MIQKGRICWLINMFTDGILQAVHIRSNFSHRLNIVHHWQFFIGDCKNILVWNSIRWIRNKCYPNKSCTAYPKKYAHGFCFAVLCCGYTLTDFPISIRLTSLALWQSNDCPSAGKATLMNMDKYFMWNHYERLHIHNKAKHNKTVCIFLGIYCTSLVSTL